MTLRRRRRRQERALWWGAAAAALAATGGGVVVLLRRTSPRAAWDRLRWRRDTSTDRRPWTCECGQRFIVTGQDRHRIYWLEEAEERDPVLGDACPSCDRRLPVSGHGVHGAAAA
jgi:hypothetical protein